MFSVRETVSSLTLVFNEGTLERANKVKLNSQYFWNRILLIIFFVVGMKDENVSAPLIFGIKYG